jgi:hypothetical protein
MSLRGPKGRGNLLQDKQNALIPFELALFFQIAHFQSPLEACHSALDAESRIIKKTGFLLPAFASTSLTGMTKPLSRF